MFQSREYIERKHGKTGTDRAYYLNQLVQEYKLTDSKEAKQQVLANLSNFAYDPINYNTLWDLSVVDLFLDTLTQEDPLLKEFGLGGLANICLESRHHEYLTSQPEYRNRVVKCLENNNVSNVLINAMTALMQFITSDNYKAILTSELEEKLKIIKADKQNLQASTMAALFLTDYYHYTF